MPDGSRLRFRKIRILTLVPRFLHQTDLFRPHNDPDDHWDLACAYALAARGMASLAGIMIDYPPGAPILNHKSDPDVGAVAQLSYITGIHPPVAVGRPEFFSSGRALNGNLPSGVRMILRQLRNSTEGMFIVVVGAARDLAEAIAREPELFQEKCRGIYLNIGSGSPNPGDVKAPEWNVKLDPSGYAQIFRAPCPIFWMPCLQDEAGAGDLHSREFGTHYRFRQGDILDDLPRSMRNYFGWMYTRDSSSTWLEALGGDFEWLLAEKSGDYRMMYSTGSFFDLAGYGVTRSGKLLPKADPEADWVYRFEPVEVACSEAGVTSWVAGDSGSNRHIFHVLDPEMYPMAMASAMRELLTKAYGTTGGEKASVHPLAAAEIPVAIS
jgi:hypothetical protein